MSLESLTPDTQAAIVVTVAVVGFIIRGVDVRLVLALGAFPLFVIAGQVPRMILLIAKEMANPGTIVPIGAALGFAYVLRLTGCDEHLVQLLLRPLRHVRWLLIPGGIAAGYLVNTVIVARPHAIEPPVSIAATGGSRERPEVIASIRPLVLTASAKSVAVTISEMTCVYA